MSFAWCAGSTRLRLWLRSVSRADPSAQSALLPDRRIALFVFQWRLVRPWIPQPARRAAFQSPQSQPDASRSFRPARFPGRSSAAVVQRGFRDVVVLWRAPGAIHEAALSPRLHASRLFPLRPESRVAAFAALQGSHGLRPALPLTLQSVCLQFRFVGTALYARSGFDRSSRQRRGAPGPGREFCFLGPPVLGRQSRIAGELAQIPVLLSAILHLLL